MRFFVLLQGELWALKRNKRIHMFVVMMLGMAAIWAIGNPDGSTFFPVLAITAAYTSVWNQTVSALAEEKERRTLEALLLTPARPLEILAAKASSGVLLATFLTAASLLLFRRAPGAPLVLLIGFLLCLGFAAASSLLAGILVQDIKSSSLHRTATLGLLIGGSIYPWHQHPGNSAFATAMHCFPVRPVEELIWGGWTGAPVPLLHNSLVMLAYILVLLAIGTRILRHQATNR